MNRIGQPVFVFGFLLIVMAGLLTSNAAAPAEPASAPWGFWGHKRINRLAVFTLPPEMVAFYKQHLEYVTTHAVDPDKRRYASENEAPRHYIDIDHYGEFPYENVPRRWDEAVDSFSVDTLMAYGIVPWHIEKMLFYLQKAFEEKDINSILHLSADLGHYVADGHVPLHTTKNYNGQLTGQHGIHGFWESRLPELYGDDYDYWVGKAQYIEWPNEVIWDFVLESAAAVDTVLNFEQMLNDDFPSDQKYSYEDRGTVTRKEYSKEYSAEYHNMMDGMVERRMRKAVISVGSFWYTAWVNAGQPDLAELGTFELSEEEKKKQEELDKKFQEGKIKGREHEH